MNEIDRILSITEEEWEDFFKGLTIEETKSLIDAIERLGE